MDSCEWQAKLGDIARIAGVGFVSSVICVNDKLNWAIC